jgi:hypothetical protein
MGFLSKLFGGGRKYSSQPSKKNSPSLSEHFTISELLIVPAPLGNVKGTVLTDEVIRSCIASVLKNNGTKVNNLIIDAMQAPFDFLSTGYNHNTERGYAAVVRDNSGDNALAPKDRRVLIGSAAYVRRATTDFHPDINGIVQRDLPVDSTLHLAAIDGIAYAAILIKREMK